MTGHEQLFAQRCQRVQHRLAVPAVATRPAARSTFACSEADAALMPASRASSVVVRLLRSTRAPRPGSRRAARRANRRLGAAGQRQWRRRGVDDQHRSVRVRRTAAGPPRSPTASGVTPAARSSAVRLVDRDLERAAAPSRSGIHAASTALHALAAPRPGPVANLGAIAAHDPRPGRSEDRAVRRSNRRSAPPTPAVVPPVQGPHPGWHAAPGPRPAATRRPRKAGARDDTMSSPSSRPSLIGSRNTGPAPLAAPVRTSAAASGQARHGAPPPPVEHHVPALQGRDGQPSSISGAGPGRTRPQQVLGGEPHAQHASRIADFRTAPKPWPREFGRPRRSWSRSLPRRYPDETPSFRARVAALAAAGLRAVRGSAAASAAACRPGSTYRIRHVHRAGRRMLLRRSTDARRATGAVPHAGQPRATAARECSSSAGAVRPLHQPQHRQVRDPRPVRAARSSASRRTTRSPGCS